MGGFYGRGCCPERRCLPLAEWPSEDARLWREALHVGDIIDGGGIRGKYRDISNRKTERGYGRFLTFWITQGMRIDVPPADRITPAAVVAYVKEMKRFGNGSYTILARLQELHDAAKVMDPTRDWSWIRKIGSRIRATAQPARNKQAKLVGVGADDLWRLGLALMARAGSARTPRVAAILHRDGLILALLALRPIRLKNLAEMTLGQHLVQRGETWWLCFSPDEVKNREYLEMPWPDDLTDALETWLTRWRPVLCSLHGRWARDCGEAVWTSSHGSPMAKQTFYELVVNRTLQAFGHSVSPHLVRDVAVTSLADVDPEHIMIAAPLLGHRDFRTTERYYLHAQRLHATRRYQATLLRLRSLRKG